MPFPQRLVEVPDEALHRGRRRVAASRGGDDPGRGGARGSRCIGLHGGLLAVRAAPDRSADPTLPLKGVEGDQDLLHLGAALDDLHDLGVAESPLRVTAGGAAARAEDLHRVSRRPSAARAAKVLATAVAMIASGSRAARSRAAASQSARDPRRSIAISATSSWIS